MKHCMNFCGNWTYHCWKPASNVKLPISCPLLYHTTSKIVCSSRAYPEGAQEYSLLQEYYSCGTPTEKGVVFRCTPLRKLTQMYCRCIQLSTMPKYLSHISSGIGVLEEYSLAWDRCTLRSTPYILCCPIWVEMCVFSAPCLMWHI